MLRHYLLVDDEARISGFHRLADPRQDRKALLVLPIMQTESYVVSSRICPFPQPVLASGINLPCPFPENSTQARRGKLTFDRLLGEEVVRLHLDTCRGWRSAGDHSGQILRDYSSR